MSTLTTGSATSTDVTPLHPFVTGPIGAVTFAAAMVVGDAFDLNKDRASGFTMSATEMLVTAGLGLVGLVIGVALGQRAWRGDTGRLSKYAVGLAIAGALTFIAFWSGWPSVFSAVAVGLAWEHRRRIGSFSPASAIAAGLGVLAFLATAYICVTG